MSFRFYLLIIGLNMCGGYGLTLWEASVSFFKQGPSTWHFYHVRQTRGAKYCLRVSRSLTWWPSLAYRQEFCKLKSKSGSHTQTQHALLHVHPSHFPLKSFVRDSFKHLLKVAEARFHLLSTVIHCLKANPKQLEDLRFPQTSEVSREYEEVQVYVHQHFAC